LEKALAALDSLNEGDFKAMAAFANPSKKLVTCITAVLNLLAGTDDRVKTKGKKADIPKPWATGL
jgi:hypothetical protein